LSDGAAELPNVTAPRLLIISGPIASGKSTLANAIAAEFRASGGTSTVLPQGDSVASV
jgi:adenylylsulfate kinase-like enzyme